MLGRFLRPILVPVPFGNVLPGFMLFGLGEEIFYVAFSSGLLGHLDYSK